MAEQTVGEAELARSFLSIPPTVSWKHFILSCGLWGLCSVINKLAVVVVVAHDHVHHSLHEGLEHIGVEPLDGLGDGLDEVVEAIEVIEGLSETKACNNIASSMFLPVFIMWHIISRMASASFA